MVCEYVAEPGFDCLHFALNPEHRRYLLSREMEVAQWTRLRTNTAASQNWLGKYWHSWLLVFETEASGIPQWYPPSGSTTKVVSSYFEHCPGWKIIKACPPRTACQHPTAFPSLLLRLGKCSCLQLISDSKSLNLRDLISRTTPCLAVFYYNTVQSERTQTFTRGGKVEAVSTNSPTNLMKRWCNELGWVRKQQGRLRKGTWAFWASD